VLRIITSPDWHNTHAGAIIGLLELSGVVQPRTSARLDKHKRETEARLRKLYKSFIRQDFLSLPVIAAYDQYYKRFNKTYHVQLQLESIVLKGKNFPDVFPLVDAAFISEIETFILTAGHDIARLHPPVTFNVSHEGDTITQLNGSSITIRAGDMVMRDADDISCTILYGQDNRSPISTATSHVLYVAYAPAGVSENAVEAQLMGIERNVRLFSPTAIVEQHYLISAAYPSTRGLI